jgi:hypothetical protein
LPRIGFKHGDIASSGQGDANRFVDPLSLEIEIEALPEAAGLGSHDPVDGRVVAGGASEDLSSDPLFVDFAGATAQREITDAAEEPRETLTLRERRGFNDPPHQCTPCFDYATLG